MPRPVAYLICWALLALFFILVIVPIVEMVNRDASAGPFSPDAPLDSSRVRIIEPDTLSFTVGLTLDYIEVIARHRAAHEARPSGWFGID